MLQEAKDSCPGEGFRMLRLVLIGPPACGKGTIANWIQRDFGPMQIVSTGAILHQLAQRQDELGEEMRAFLASGELMEDERITRILFQALQDLPGRVANNTLNGYPRTLRQAQLLEGHGAKPDMVCIIDIPKETIRERILDRWLHGASGRTYSYSFNPPKKPGIDDITGEPLVRRNDDDLECFERRFKNYTLHKDALIKYYEDRGIAFISSGNDSPAIYSKLKGRLTTLTLPLRQ